MSNPGVTVPENGVLGSTLETLETNNEIEESAEDEEGTEDDETLSIYECGLPLEITSAMMRGVFSDGPATQLGTTRRFREILEDRDSDTFMMDENIVPRLVELLKTDNPLLQAQYEVASILSNIGCRSSEYVEAMIASGATPELIRLLSSPDPDVHEQALWTLGNIAGDGLHCRDHILEAGVLPPLLKLLSENTKESLLRIGAWTLKNLVRGRTSRPNWEIVSPALPVLIRLLDSDDEETLVDAVWALANSADGSDYIIQIIVETGVTQRAIELMGHEVAAVQAAAVRLVGNIATSDEQINNLLSLGIISGLLPLLSSRNPHIRKDVCWTISNIAFGLPCHVEAIANAAIMSGLTFILEHDEPSVVREACWAIANALKSWPTPTLIELLIDRGCVKGLCGTCTKDDGESVEMALDALYLILAAGEGGGDSLVNKYAKYLEDVGGLPSIHQLQHHDSLAVRQKTLSIIRQVVDGLP